MPNHLVGTPLEKDSFVLHQGDPWLETRAARKDESTQGTDLGLPGKGGVLTTRPLRIIGLLAALIKGIT